MGRLVIEGVLVSQARPAFHKPTLTGHRYFALNCFVMSKAEKKDKNARSSLSYTEYLFLYLWVCVESVLQVFLEVAHIMFQAVKKKNKTCSMLTAIYSPLFPTYSICKIFL